MSIDRLHYFAAVVETKNLRKASELVGISAPSMSKAISVLEGELGYKLIQPEGRGISITTKGMEVYHSSIALLEEHKRFFQKITASEIKTDQIRLGTFEVFSSHFLSGFMASEPKYEILCLEKTPGEMEQSILAGTIDYGLTYLPSPDSALDYVEVGSFEMGLYGSKKWESLEFKEWPFAIPVTEVKIHSSEFESLDMYSLQSPKRKIKYRFELLETALQSSSEGLSVIHCPDFISKLFNEKVKASYQLHRLSEPKGYKKNKIQKVYLVGKKGNVEKELERKLAKFMRSLKSQ